MRLNKYVQVRIPMETYNTLIQTENYSEWIRDAINEKLKRENNKDLIEIEIKKHKNAIEELMKKKQGPPVKKDKINDIIDKAKHNFNKFKRYDIPDEYNIKWLNNHVIPDLKKNGWDGSVNDLLDEVSKG